MLTSIFIFIAGSLLSAFCMYFYFSLNLRNKNSEALQVIQSIIKGDLKARVETGDEPNLAHMIGTFNQLANHLEVVVNRFTDSEQRKIQLIQELGHDLRTPITATRIALENVQAYFDKMTQEQRNQGIRRAMEEIAYMQRLIEFLFVIAKVDLPDYQVSFQKMDLLRLIEKEVSVRNTGVESRIEWKTNWGGEAAIWINGDRSLVVRLVRNLLDNAQKFAKKRVTITWTPSSAGIGILTIHDDGQGMTEKSLAEFGRVRKTKVEISDAFKTGQSMGIGSSIVKAISDLHDWRMKVAAVREGETGTMIYFEIRSLPALPAQENDAA